MIAYIINKENVLMEETNEDMKDTIEWIQQQKVYKLLKCTQNECVNAVVHNMQFLWNILYTNIISIH